MKYRIKNIELVGYFAQVKRHFFSDWKTIGKHVNGAGEYPENHLDHPLDQRWKAVELAHKHADYNKVIRGFTNYDAIL